MHGCQSAWQRMRQRGRHEWRIGVFVCYWRLWLVERGRRCTTVPVHAEPCMSADTAWTGRAVGREANEGGPAARAWYDPASWRWRLIVLLCSSQTAAGRVDSVELRPADCYSSRLWRWRNCWQVFSWRPSTGLEHSSLFGVIGGYWPEWGYWPDIGQKLQ